MRDAKARQIAGQRRGVGELEVGRRAAGGRSPAGVDRSATRAAARHQTARGEPYGTARLTAGGLGLSRLLHVGRRVDHDLPPLAERAPGSDEVDRSSCGVEQQQERVVDDGFAALVGVGDRRRR